MKLWLKITLIALVLLGLEALWIYVFGVEI